MALFSSRKSKPGQGTTSDTVPTARKPPPIELLSLRNPPMAGGVPFFEPEDLLRLHNDLLLQIRIASGAGDEEFSRYYMTAARAYASFVHALPASRAHHHRGAGGMLRHGLEVAFFALRHIEGQFFSRVGTPEERRNDEPRWRLATFLAALGHDLGKVVCDISVFDSTKRRKWVPFSESLFDWGARHNLDVYHPQWNEGRDYHSHEPVSAICADFIISPHHRAYLCQGAPTIIGSMMMAITGNKAMAQNLILDAITRADSDSTSGSLKSSTTVVDGIQTTDSPAEALLGVARRLSLESWIPNVPGNRVVISNEAIYLIWPLAHDDIKARARSEGVSSIQQEPDQAAETLILSGLATPYTRQGASPSNLWRIVPKYPQATGTMPRWALKLSRAAGLYETFNGPRIECQVVEPGLARNTDTTFDNPPIDDTSTTTVPPTVAEVADHAAAPEAGTVAVGGSGPSVPNVPPQASTPDAAKVATPSSPQAAAPKRTEGKAKASSQKTPQQMLRATEQKPNASAVSSESPTTAWLRKLGETGILLENMLERARTTGATLEVAAFNGEPCLIFDVQTIESLLGIPIRDLAAMLDEARLIIRDDKTPTLFTVPHPKKPKVRVLGFTHRASSLLLAEAAQRKGAHSSVQEPATASKASVLASPTPDPMMVPQTEVVAAPKFPAVLNTVALKLLVEEAKAGGAGFAVMSNQLYANLGAIVQTLTLKVPELTKGNIKDWCYCAGVRVLKPRLVELNLPALAPAYCFTIKGGDLV